MPVRHERVCRCGCGQVVARARKFVSQSTTLCGLSASDTWDCTDVRTAWTDKRRESLQHADGGSLASISGNCEVCPGRLFFPALVYVPVIIGINIVLLCHLAPK
jgi:hypothetical protein